jgi:hypothetical protein
MSEELRVALGRLPSQPSAGPVKVEEGSTQDSIMVAWAAQNEVDGVDIEGYSLYMDDGHHGPFAQVYDGSVYP